MAPQKAKGFSLIEVMITVVIVAILASIAVPSYRQYVLRANRTVAKTALTDLVARQEGYKVDRKRYALSLDKLGFGAATLYLDRDGVLATSSNDNSIYQVSLAGNPGFSSCSPGGSASTGGFTIVMTPIGAQARDKQCGLLCESSAGIRGASGSGTDCWTR